MQAAIRPTGFAKLLLVLLALSGIATNAVSIYSASLSMQQMGRPLGVVPRFFWTSLMFVAVVLLSLVSRDKFIGFLENFLSLLGYWVTSFFIIIFCEHYVFRRGSYQHYDLEAWNTPSLMPVGLAGGLAFAAGVGASVAGISEGGLCGRAGRSDWRPQARRRPGQRAGLCVHLGRVRARAVARVPLSEAVITARD